MCGVALSLILIILSGISNTMTECNVIRYTTSTCKCYATILLAIGPCPCIVIRVSPAYINYYLMITLYMVATAGQSFIKQIADKVLARERQSKISTSIIDTMQVVCSLADSSRVAIKHMACGLHYVINRVQLKVPL